MNWGNATATETLNMFTQRMQGMGDAALMAMKQLSQIVHRQAVVMGYGDAFFMLTAVLFRPQPAGDAAEEAACDWRRAARDTEKHTAGDRSRALTRLSYCKSPVMHL